MSAVLYFIVVRKPKHWFVRRGKAVSHGAVWHYLGGYIAARVAGWTFGTTSVIDFDADDSEHLARKDHLVLSPSGMIGVAGHFAPLLVKVSVRLSFGRACTDGS